MFFCITSIVNLYIRVMKGERLYKSRNFRIFYIIALIGLGVYRFKGCENLEKSKTGEEIRREIKVRDSLQRAKDSINNTESFRNMKMMEEPQRRPIGF